MADLIATFKKIIAAYNMILIVFGTIGNILTITICLRKRLRKINTFKLFAFNALLDTIGLYEWNLRQFVLYYFNIDLSFTYLWYCNLSSFLQYVSFETSAWFLVIIYFNLNFLSIEAF
jgi:hypothetical protein